MSHEGPAVSQSTLTVCCGLVLTGGQLESLMETMRAEIAAQPPVEGSYAPRRGDYCIAKFADGEWYECLIAETFTLHLLQDVARLLIKNCFPLDGTESNLRCSWRLHQFIYYI